VLVLVLVLLLVLAGLVLLLDVLLQLWVQHVRGHAPKDAAAVAQRGHLHHIGSATYVCDACEYYT
jgi:hypothetical protein